MNHVAALVVRDSVCFIVRLLPNLRICLLTVLDLSGAHLVNLQYSCIEAANLQDGKSMGIVVM